MCNPEFPLQSETIVFTGSKEPFDAIEQVKTLGGKTLYLPLIETSVRQSQLPDFERYDWLIFTSGNSADAFCQLHIATDAKMAAVGEKTAEILQQHGYTVDFMPSVYSADVFIQEFPDIAGNVDCLFIKGSLAKNTIASMPMKVDEWIIYETTFKIENAKKLAALQNVTVLFASPSAVSAYREAGGDWSGIRVAAIGHVTENAIRERGGKADFTPKKYTYTDVINEIAKGSYSNE